MLRNYCCIAGFWFWLSEPHRVNFINIFVCVTTACCCCTGLRFETVVQQKSTQNVTYLKRASATE